MCWVATISERLFFRSLALRAAATATLGDRPGAVLVPSHGFAPAALRRTTHEQGQLAAARGLPSSVPPFLPGPLLCRSAKPAATRLPPPHKGSCCDGRPTQERPPAVATRGIIRTRRGRRGLAHSSRPAGSKSPGHHEPGSAGQASDTAASLLAHGQV
eukprot:157646-Chlamydomonas_euryale.AAC.4